WRRPRAGSTLWWALVMGWEGVGVADRWILRRLWRTFLGLVLGPPPVSWTGASSYVRRLLGMLRVMGAYRVRDMWWRLSLEGVGLQRSCALVRGVWWRPPRCFVRIRVVFAGFLVVGVGMGSWLAIVWQRV